MYYKMSKRMYNMLQEKVGAGEQNVIAYVNETFYLKHEIKGLIIV